VGEEVEVHPVCVSPPLQQTTSGQEDALLDLTGTSMFLFHFATPNSALDDESVVFEKELD